MKGFDDAKELNYFTYKNNCYHGTKKCNVESILNDGFNESDDEDEYLGTGVYFYEKDIYQAISWCKRAKEYENPAVLKAMIETDKLIDLTITVHYNVIRKLANAINYKYKRNFNGEELCTKDIFDILYKIKSYDVIKHTFVVPKGGNIIGTEIKRVQIQVCVRNQNVI